MCIIKEHSLLLCIVTLNSKYLTSTLHFQNRAFLKKAVMKKWVLGTCVDNGKGFEQLSKYKKTWNLMEF